MEHNPIASHIYTDNEIYELEIKLYKIEKEILEIKKEIKGTDETIKILNKIHFNFIE